MKKIKIDDLFYQSLTEKQKENLKKIKEFLEKENQKAREHQKIRRCDSANNMGVFLVFLLFGIKSKINILKNKSS